MHVFRKKRYHSEDDEEDDEDDDEDEGNQEGDEEEAEEVPVAKKYALRSQTKTL
jgi:hypothetical protein